MDAEIQATDGNYSDAQVFGSTDLSTHDFISLVTGTPVLALCCHPWTLDFGIHAEMTAFLAWLSLCITMNAERGNGFIFIN